jgi:peptidyl-tRNA hydrolase
MTKGKAIAQACHGMARMAVFMDKNQSINWENYMKNGEKKITVRASQTEFDKLNQKYENGTNKKVFCFRVIDAGLTQIPEGSETCLVFNPIKTEDIPEDLKLLKLY